MSGFEPRILSSARRHAIDDADILLAFRNPIRDFRMDEGMTMRIGGDQQGRLLEIWVVHRSGDDLIVHAMPARQKFLWEV